MNEDVRRAARKLWDFHCIYDALGPADVIIGLGSYDIRVALRCAELFHAGHAPRIVFTGASGNWTRGLFPGREADAFREAAERAGVPAGAIAVEAEATNIGENIRFSRDLAPGARDVILVTKPQTQRRCRATMDRQWPEVRAAITAPLTAYEDQPLPHHDERALICEMVGDLRRFRPYAELGFQTAVAVPDEVAAAADLLVDAGFTDHLPKEALGG
ncbi:YdcF family protein [Pontivivens ytuae]|uniref:YdcF family protein n=1 Tax=Pontivivens ytuae TaxID=2789856 RepID=A0A7S9LWP9_9RHOB|nr:YdcF family protein [Pontivivens ytuae]